MGACAFGGSLAAPLSCIRAQCSGMACRLRRRAPSGSCAGPFSLRAAPRAAGGDGALLRAPPVGLVDGSALIAAGAAAGGRRLPARVLEQGRHAERHAVRGVSGQRPPDAPPGKRRVRTAPRPVAEDGRRSPFPGFPVHPHAALTCLVAGLGRPGCGDASGSEPGCRGKGRDADVVERGRLRHPAAVLRHAVRRGASACVHTASPCCLDGVRDGRRRTVARPHRGVPQSGIASASVSFTSSITM